MCGGRINLYYLPITWLYRNISVSVVIARKSADEGIVTWFGWWVRARALAVDRTPMTGWCGGVNMAFRWNGWWGWWWEGGVVAAAVIDGRWVYTNTNCAPFLHMGHECPSCCPADSRRTHLPWQCGADSTVHLVARSIVPWPGQRKPSDWRIACVSQRTHTRSPANKTVYTNR